MLQLQVSNTSCACSFQATRLIDIIVTGFQKLHCQFCGYIFHRRVTSATLLYQLVYHAPWIEHWPPTLEGLTVIYTWTRPRVKVEAYGVS